MTSIMTKPFHFLCIISAISAITYCLYRFMLNEDMTSIEFRRFDGIGNNIYPVISLCFSEPGIFNILELNRLVGYKSSERKNAKRYLDFLEGKIWSKKYLNVSYESVSVDIGQIIDNVKVHSSDTEKGNPLLYEWQEKDNNSSKEVPFTPSYKSHNDKCFTFDTNVKTISSLEIKEVEMKSR